MGAVPFQEAKWARVGNRAMSPVSISSRAAPDGPIPCRLVSVVLVAWAVRQLFIGGFGALIDALEVADQLGRYLPACPPAASRGRTLTSSAGLGCGQALLGAAGDELQQQPVQLATIRCGPRRAPAPVSQDPQHRQLLVATTGRSPAMRVATSATECASVASVLRPWPLANTRPGRTAWAARRPPVRRRPAAGWRYAGQCPGSPRSPRPAPASRCASASIDRYPAVSVANLPTPRTASSLAMISIVADRLCGSIPITTCHLALPLELPYMPEPGGHRYFERRANPSRASPCSPRHPVRAGHGEPTPSVGSRIASDEPGT